MGTIVAFHAHPDDESIITSGLLSLASDAGHRVVLVFATRGELGEPVPGVLDEGEQLTLRRTAESYESAAVIGAQRVEFMGYIDSGMMGEATNDAPWCFWQAGVESAAARLAALLAEERPDVLVIYDDHGGYGHPDHIQVHRVGMAAGSEAGVPIVAQVTMNRDLIVRSIAAARDAGMEIPEGAPTELPPDLGSPEEIITHRVDGAGVIDRKRRSMRAHASQIAPEDHFLSMPIEAFTEVFGPEWYIVDHELPAEVPAVFSDLFTPLR